jgi:elongation factor P--beta-lysine ligase
MEFRERLSEETVERAKSGKTKFPVDSRLLKAMESGLTSSSGTALGIVRLLLYILNANSINDVITFPIELC